MGKIGSSSDTHRTIIVIISFFDPWNMPSTTPLHFSSLFHMLYTTKPVWRPTGTTFPNAWMLKVGDMTQESWTIDPGTRPRINVLLEYVFQKEATFMKQCHDSVNMLQHSDTRAKYITGRLDVSWGKGKSFNFGVHSSLQAQEKSWTTTAVEYRCRIWTVR